MICFIRHCLADKEVLKYQQVCEFTDKQFFACLPTSVCGGGGEGCGLPTLPPVPLSPLATPLVVAAVCLHLTCYIKCNHWQGIAIAITGLLAYSTDLNLARQFWCKKAPESEIRSKIPNKITRVYQLIDQYTTGYSKSVSASNVSNGSISLCY